MTDLIPDPLTAEDFAPYGLVLEHGQNAVGERAAYPTFMRNDRPEASLGLAIARKGSSSLPMTVKWLERHPHSSQAFISVDLPAFLVLVAPTGADGSPVVDALRAFVGRSTQGICYKPDVWHHPFVVLGAAGEFLTLRYDDGGDRDTLWYEVEDGPRVLEPSAS